MPRHIFIDEALASRAYEDTALPIGQGQTISQPWVVARMTELARNGRELGNVLEIGKGLLVALHIGRMKDAGTLVPEQISFGKLNNVRTAIAIARQARTIFGGNGVALEYSPMRHANNLEGVRTYEGTDEVHILIMGRAITGIPAFS